jgi:dihydroorotate dehydrogenase electron transfer subunit
MKKYILDLKVVSNEMLGDKHVLMKLTSDGQLPATRPGQFVEVRVDHSPTTFLRRPISIHYVDEEKNELWLLIQLVGDGTRQLAEVKKGEIVNVVMPLGNGFTEPSAEEKCLLLVGGGVGIAPLLQLGKELKAKGIVPNFLLGGRSAKDLIQLEEYKKIGNVFVTTEDGSLGEKGFVTNHSVLSKENFSKIYTCGPTPMMKAVASYAMKSGIECEVSLENKMACGLGACLCCVTETQEGHKCVCSDGPVFNIKDLSWQI